MEQAVIFRVRDDELLGILHPGDHQHATRGVLIVVGGPQYRVGSHRQFLLVARFLADAGVPVFRFDYRGMGDSDGAMRDFEAVDEDIRAAIDTFQANTPGLQEVVIWGLCDAASAALTYAFRDDRVAGLVLLNPWVRTEEGLARVYLKTYYLQRFVSRDFWGALMHGKVNPVVSLGSLFGMLAKVAGGRRGPAAVTDDTEVTLSGALPERMAAGWRRFSGPILLILSGDDLTAAEFRDTAANHAAWRGLLDEARVTRRELSEANHTFSRREWRDQVAEWTLEWVRGIGKFELGSGKGISGPPSPRPSP